MLSCDNVSTGSGYPQSQAYKQLSHLRRAQHASRRSEESRNSTCCNATLRKRRQAWEGGEENGKRTAVLKYVREAQPEEVKDFLESSSPQVVSAMRQTVCNMVGTLPPNQFSVTIDTVADSLATLMQTMLRTGYLLRSAQYQLEIQSLITQAQSCNSSATASGHSWSWPNSNSSSLCAAPLSAYEPDMLNNSSSSSSMSTSSNDELMNAFSGGVNDGSLVTAAGKQNGWQHPEDQYAPGVQHSKIEGDVLRWHLSNGVERLPAQQYVKMLEDEVKSLKLQLAQQKQQAAQHAAQQAWLLPSSSSPADKPAASSVLPASFSNKAVDAMGSTNSSHALSSTSSSDLLGYLRSLDAATLAALGTCGPEIAEAMSAFVARLMGTSEREQLRTMTSEFSAVDLSKLLFWLLVVGWMLRTLEANWELGSDYDSSSPPRGPSTPPTGTSPSNNWLLPGW